MAKVALGRALVPLLLGLGAARLSPRFATAVGPWTSKIINAALVVLLIVAVAVAVAWRYLAGISGLGWLAGALAAAGAIAIGHLLGGPDPGTRGVVGRVRAARRLRAGHLTAARKAEPIPALRVVARTT